ALAEERHVEVDPPLAPLAAVVARGRERLGQIHEACKAARAPLDYLVAVHALGARSERFERGGIAPAAPERHARADLDLAHPDPGGLEGVEGRPRLLEFDRHVTGVEADAEVAAEERLGLGAAEAGERGESFGSRAAKEMALEARDRLRHRFQVAAGLRLER